MAEYFLPEGWVMQELSVYLRRIKIMREDMATPVRMAPVLTGKDADYFMKSVEKGLKTPDTSAPTKQERERYKEFMTKHRLSR